MNYDSSSMQTASMSSLQRAGYAGPDDAPPLSGSSRLTMSMARAAELCARVQGLADRLCGSVPQAVNTTSGQIKGPGPGILPQLESHASELDDFVQRAHAALSRIDNSL